MARFHEFCRKRIVSLKRKPHMIPFAVMLAAFIYYSLNLTVISHTTTVINGPGMGLTGFVTMLFSTLSLVCFLNAFPHRKKVNVPMLVLMLLLVCAVLYCDVYYRGCIITAITREQNRIDPTGINSFISVSSGMLNIHMIILCAGIVLVALLPLYAPLIRRINTSVQVEGNDSMETIDISGEE